MLHRCRSRANVQSVAIHSKAKWSVGPKSVRSKDSAQNVATDSSGAKCSTRLGKFLTGALNTAALQSFSARPFGRASAHFGLTRSGRNCDSQSLFGSGASWCMSSVLSRYPGSSTHPPVPLEPGESRDIRLYMRCVGSAGRLSMLFWIFRASSLTLYSIPSLLRARGTSVRPRCTWAIRSGTQYWLSHSGRSRMSSLG